MKICFEIVKKWEEVLYRKINMIIEMDKLEIINMYIKYLVVINK